MTAPLPKALLALIGDPEEDQQQRTEIDYDTPESSDIDEDAFAQFESAFF